MSEVSFAEFKDEEVRAFLNDLENKLKKIEGGKKEYAGLLSAIVYADVMDHFDKEMGSAGPWKQWSKFYIEQMKANEKSGNKILQDTGRMRNKFMPNKVRSVSSGLLWFNNAQTKGGFPYAFAHDEGGPKLPKRDFMWLSSQAMDKISEQTLQFMLDKGI